MTEEACRQLNDWYTRGTRLRIEANWGIGIGSVQGIAIWMFGCVTRWGDRIENNVITIAMGNGTFRLFPGDLPCLLEHFDPPAGDIVCWLRIGTPGQLFAILSETA